MLRRPIPRSTTRTKASPAGSAAAGAGNACRRPARCPWAGPAGRSPRWAGSHQQVDMLGFPLNWAGSAPEVRARTRMISSIRSASPTEYLVPVLGDKTKWTCRIEDTRLPSGCSSYRAMKPIIPVGCSSVHTVSTRHRAGVCPGVGVRVRAGGVRQRAACPAGGASAGRRTSPTLSCRPADRIKTTGAGTGWAGFRCGAPAIPRDLNTAYRECLRRPPGTRKGPKIEPPSLKSRKDHRPAVRFTASARSGCWPAGSCVLPRNWDVSVRWSRDLPSEPSSVTVIRDSAGRYFASFVVETGPVTSPGRDR